MPNSMLNPSRRLLLKGMGLLPAFAYGLGGLSRQVFADELSCTVAPAMTEGPYWLDKKLHRVDLRTDTSRASVTEGLPFTLKIKVYNADGNSCTEEPVENVQIDAWHADAIGEYSGVSGNGQSDTKSESFLRGYQITDANGMVHFTTIYPGWYVDRATHIHIRARAYDASGNTIYDFVTQLFFDDSLTDIVYANAPYNSRGTRDTLNSNDMHYLGVSTPLLLNVTTNDDGSMTGEVALGLSSLPSEMTPLNNFSISTTTTGDKSAFSITSTLNINELDIGTTGSIYVLADVNGTWYVRDGETWVPYTLTMENAFPAVYTGILNNQHTINVLSNINVDAFGTVKLYVGYGANTVDMLGKQQYQVAYTQD